MCLAEWDVLQGRLYLFLLPELHAFRRRFSFTLSGIELRRYGEFCERKTSRLYELPR